MSYWRFVGCVFIAIGISLSMNVASGQTYPFKPIRIVVTGPGGGPTDLPARVIAQGISGALGQPVIIDNRVDNIAVELVSKAPSDGYTLMAAGAGFIMEPLLRTTLYDPIKDFSPITLAVSPPAILVVNPSLPANSVNELISLAKAKPGALNFGSGGVGGGAHLAGELFKSMAGINIVHVPYKGAGPVMNDLIGSQLQLAFIAASVALPQVKAGKLRALAVTSAQPSELLPGIPTVASTLPGYESSNMVGMYAPAKTPPSIISRLNEEMVRQLRQSGNKDKLLGIGLDVIGNSPEQFSAIIKSEIAKWGKLIKELGLRVE